LADSELSELVEAEYLPPGEYPPAGQREVITWPGSQPENQPENQPESQPESQPENQPENQPESQTENLTVGGLFLRLGLVGKPGEILVDWWVRRLIRGGVIEIGAELPARPARSRQLKRG